MSEYAPYEPRRQDGRPRPPVDPDCIRTARPEDAAGIAALIAARHDIPLERALDGVRREFAGIAAGHRRQLLVADVDGGVVGFGRMHYLEGETGVPDGWFLTGVIVHRAYRRQGLGSALTRARLTRIRQRSAEAWYFANKGNRASIELHARLGFVEVDADFAYERAKLAPGEGSLYRVDLR